LSSETAIPGGVYLCQVSENVSCAACCGLYNAPDGSFAGLQKMLAERTQRFERLPRSAEDITDFGRQVESDQLHHRPWVDFHHCPFVGLIGDRRQRVGCLLHPLADGNKGIDYRGLSYYGGMACRQYFCPSHRDLPPEVKKIVRRLAGDWYAYGLVITETTLLGALIAEIQNRVAATLSPSAVSDHPAFSRKLRDLLFVKIDWPFRQDNGKGLCHYFFTDRMVRREPVDYAAAGRQPVGFETIFTELASRFQTADELLSAERRLELLFRQAAEAFPGSLL